VVELDIQVAEAFADRVDVEDLARYVQRALALEGIEEGALTVVITDTDTVRELNRTYRGVDAATDVLSFALNEGEAMMLPEEEPPYLGDVIIAFPVAKEQAIQYGHSVQEELRLLAVHGVLHLLGYDHATPEEEAVMWARQAEILGREYVGPRGERRQAGG